MQAKQSQRRNEAQVREGTATVGGPRRAEGLVEVGNPSRVGGLVRVGGPSRVEGMRKAGLLRVEGRGRVERPTRASPPRKEPSTSESSEEDSISVEEESSTSESFESEDEESSTSESSTSESSTSESSSEESQSWIDWGAGWAKSGAGWAKRGVGWALRRAGWVKRGAACAYRAALWSHRSHLTHISIFFLMFVGLALISLDYGGFDTAKCDIAIDRANYTDRISLYLFRKYLKEKAEKEEMPWVMKNMIHRTFNKNTNVLIDIMDKFLTFKWRGIMAQKKENVPASWCGDYPGFIPTMNHTVREVYLMIDLAMASLEVDCFDALKETSEETKDFVTEFFYFGVEMEVQYWEIKGDCEGVVIPNFLFWDLLEERRLQFNELLEKQGRFRRITNAIRQLQGHL